MFPPLKSHELSKKLIFLGGSFFFGGGVPDCRIRRTGPRRQSVRRLPSAPKCPAPFLGAKVSGALPRRQSVRRQNGWRQNGGAKTTAPKRRRQYGGAKTYRTGFYSRL